MRDAEETRVLVVEDNSLDRKLLSIHLKSHGYAPRIVIDGLEAWEILEREPETFDVILLDRTMPRMDGMELLTRIKAHPRLRMIPVIIQTASIAREDILEGIRAGAYYYLTKPYDPEVLVAVVRTAANDHAEYRELQEHIRKGLKSLRLMSGAVFTFRTISEARDIASILANTCPDPVAAVVGLTELLLNAVEHGNLGITYEEKSQLESKIAWYAEVERRTKLPENAGKQVRLLFERDEEGLRFTIHDEGKGFDWQHYIEVEPQRAFDTHGRGIAIARRLSFTSIEYRGNGNEVVAWIETEPDSRPAIASGSR